MSDKDYIGPDPIKWIDRLLEVNESSAFTPMQKGCIKGWLSTLRDRLHREPFDE